MPKTKPYGCKKKQFFFKNGCGRDVEGSYIANTDYAALEFIRKGKQNLTYKVYPNYDHIYFETTRKFGEEVELGFKANVVIDDIFNWIEK